MSRTWLWSVISDIELHHVALMTGACHTQGHTRNTCGMSHVWIYNSSTLHICMGHIAHRNLDATHMGSVISHMLLHHVALMTGAYHTQWKHNTCGMSHVSYRTPLCCTYDIIRVMSHIELHYVSSHVSYRTPLCCTYDIIRLHYVARMTEAYHTQEPSCNTYGVCHLWYITPSCRIRDWGITNTHRDIPMTHVSSYI